MRQEKEMDVEFSGNRKDDPTVSNKNRNM